MPRTWESWINHLFAFFALWMLLSWGKATGIGLLDGLIALSGVCTLSRLGGFVERRFPDITGSAALMLLWFARGIAHLLCVAFLFTLTGIVPLTVQQMYPYDQFGAVAFDHQWQAGVAINVTLAALTLIYHIYADRQMRRHWTRYRP